MQGGGKVKAATSETIAADPAVNVAVAGVEYASKRALEPRVEFSIQYRADADTDQSMIAVALARFIQDLGGKYCNAKSIIVNRKHWPAP